MATAPKPSQNAKEAEAKTEPHHEAPAKHDAPPSLPGVIDKEAARAAFLGGHKLAEATPADASDEEKAKARANFVMYQRVADLQLVCRAYREEDLDKVLPKNPVIVN